MSDWQERAHPIYALNLISSVLTYCPRLNEVCKGPPWVDFMTFFVICWFLIHLFNFWSWRTASVIPFPPPEFILSHSTIICHSGSWDGSPHETVLCLLKLLCSLTRHKLADQKTRKSLGREEFRLLHYAGEVTYSVAGKCVPRLSCLSLFFPPPSPSLWIKSASLHSKDKSGCGVLPFD